MRQAPNEVIDVALWAADEDFPIYPVGSKPKKLVVSPAELPAAFLKPKQGYLFKGAHGWQAASMWSEIIAYEISRVLGVNVPPSFVAVNSNTGETGALIEFFYPYPAPKKSLRLVHAADFMQEQFANDKKGRPHSLRGNLAVCRLLKAPDALTWWAEAILFDTLIGNTDRHPENWGFLVEQAEAQTAILAPLYDNGTSLGYGVQEGKLDPPWDPVRVGKFVARGTHDIGWSREEDGPTEHLGLCARFFTTYPRCRSIAKRLLSFTDDQIRDIVGWAERFSVPVPFTHRRGQFIVQQLAVRRDSLVKAIGL